MEALSRQVWHETSSLRMLYGRRPIRVLAREVVQILAQLSVVHTLSVHPARFLEDTSHSLALEYLNVKLLDILAIGR